MLWFRHGIGYNDRALAIRRTIGEVGRKQRDYKNSGETPERKPLYSYQTKVIYHKQKSVGNTASVGVFVMDYKIDSHKLMYHPERVAQLRAATTWEEAKEVYPIYVEISPVGACNHRCSFCALDFIGYQNSMLDTDRLLKTMKEMSLLGVKSTMAGGEGEPLLHKDINGIVEGAWHYGLDLAFTTNGILLDKLEMLEWCKWIKVSINAGTKETYAKIHGTKEKDWDKVWENLKQAVQRKGDCTIGVQSLLLYENCGEMFALADKCKDIGVDYMVIKPYSQHKSSINLNDIEYGQYMQASMDAGLMSSKDFRVIVRDNAMRKYSETDHYDRCLSVPFLWAYIMANGDVYGCSAYLLDERFKYGNINEQSFKEIWQGPKREENYYYMKEMDVSGCRRNCRMDNCNRYLTEFDTPHVNFI